MKLSSLQKYILLQCFDSKRTLDRRILLEFYGSAKKKLGQNIMVNSITNSLERLIKKGLIVGFGEITKDKIFITKIRLTRAGSSVAKKALGEQRHLPFKAKF
jgi:hypothetical protein